MWRKTAIHELANFASMKVPPKRKGNHVLPVITDISHQASMKVPPKRKGNE